MSRKRNGYGYEPVGSLWKSDKPSKHGDTYFTGKIELPGGAVIRVTMYANKRKSDESHPDLVLYASAGDLDLVEDMYTQIVQAVSAGRGGGSADDRGNNAPPRRLEDIPF